MDFQPGLAVIDPAAADNVVEAASQAGLPVFILATGGRVGREAFFDAARTALPLDPPLRGSRSWDALSDSAWEGLRSLDARKIVILWPDATAFENDVDSDYELAISVLRSLADSLADSRITNGRPKEVSIFVGRTSP